MECDMNSKFLVLTSLLFLNVSCAGNMQVAKTDMPEDDTVATAPALEQPKKQMDSRMPASVDQDKKSCESELKSENCK
jgi:hypothetical protein